MKSFMIFLLFSQPIYSNNNNHCRFSFMNVAGIVAKDDILRTYYSLFSEIGSNLNPNDIALIVKSGNPFQLPSEISLPSHTLKDSLAAFEALLTEHALLTLELKELLIQSLENKVKSTTELEIKQTQNDIKNFGPLIIKWSDGPLMELYPPLMELYPLMNQNLIGKDRNEVLMGYHGGPSAYSFDLKISNKYLRKYKINSKKIKEIAISPDENALYVTFDEVPAIFVANLKDSTSKLNHKLELKILVELENEALGLKISPDGKYLLSSWYDTNIIPINNPTNISVITDEVFQHEFIDFTADSKAVLLINNNKIQKFNLDAEPIGNHTELSYFHNSTGMKLPIKTKPAKKFTHQHTILLQKQRMAVSMSGPVFKPELFFIDLIYGRITKVNATDSNEFASKYRNGWQMPVLKVSEDEKYIFALVREANPSANIKQNLESNLMVYDIQNKTTKLFPLEQSDFGGLAVDYKNDNIYISFYDPGIVKRFSYKEFTEN